MDNLRRPFDKQDPFAIHTPDNRRHELAFRRKRQFLKPVRLPADIQIINPMLPQPEQQGSLGGIAQYHNPVFTGNVKLGGGIQGDAFYNQVCKPATKRHLGIVQCIEIGPIDLHPVLCQGACLVCTDDGNRSHRLTGMHLPDQVMRGKHPAHAVSQCQGDRHRQPLWYSHHDNRHRKHQ